MTDHDLAELYTYLLTFNKIYDDKEKELKELTAAIRDRFVEQAAEAYGEDVDAAMKRLRNPRQAGRKQSITPEQSVQIIKLHNEGKSIRKISKETNIARSTIQRHLINEKSKVSHI